jgi:3-oxoacyl-[acyl-carrier protein] reductase
VSDTAIITGGGSGAARPSRALHGAGYRVAVTDIDAGKAASVAEALDPGETAIDLRLDVTDGAIEAVACEIDKRWGGVQVLVNNAVLTRAVPVLDITLDDWDQVMAVNARGTFAASQIFARRMKAAGYGRSSMASLPGRTGHRHRRALCRQQGCDHHADQGVRPRSGAHGITVNAIAPGPIDSPMVRALVPEEKMPGMLAGIPVGHLGMPVSSPTWWCVWPRAMLVSGATWDINGGLFMR